MPFRSVTQCRFVPARPRPVGFGPVSPPPFLPRWTRHPARHGTSRARPLGRAIQAGCGATGPTLPPFAVALEPMARHGSPNLAGAASRSCPSSRTPRAAASRCADLRLPRQAGAQNEHDPAQGIAARHLWTTALRLRWLLGQQRLNNCPHLIRHKLMSHEHRIHETEIGFVRRFNALSNQCCAGVERPHRVMPSPNSQRLPRVARLSRSPTPPTKGSVTMHRAGGITGGSREGAGCPIHRDETASLTSDSSFLYTDRRFVMRA